MGLRKNAPSSSKHSPMPRILPAFAFLLMLAAGTSALAQFGGMRRGGMDSGGSGRSRSGGDDLSGVTRMSPNDQIRMQITSARLALKLTPEQNPLFQAYEDRVIELLSDLGRGTNAREGDDALKQIERKVDQARNRLAAMEEISDAAKKLYAVLTPEQKTAADRVIPGTVPALSK
jgi:hypothetical protein